MGVSNDGIICYGFDLGEIITEDIVELADQDFNKFVKATWPLLNVVWHCSYDYTMFIIAVKDTVTQCSRGYPANLGSSNRLIMLVEPDAEEQLRQALAFFTERDLTASDIGWLLCTMNG